jgi:hypothetical protein
MMHELNEPKHKDTNKTYPLIRIFSIEEKMFMVKTKTTTI